MDMHERVIQDVLAGKNVLLQGKAGTGKSTLIEKVKERLGPDRVTVTATTGISASLINGVTLHSWAGLGLAQDDARKLASNIRPVALKRWRDKKLLIIEEISMLSAELFDKYSQVGQILRGDRLHAFGGIQLMAVGDFLQLPPVAEREKKAQGALFTFEAKHWELAKFQIHVLTHVWRQTDVKFVAALDEIRIGKCSSQTKTLLRDCIKKKLPEVNGIKPTKLFCTRANVDYENRTELDRLPGPMTIFTAQDHGDGAKLSKCLWPSILSLKVGAQVMYLKNDSARNLVNGSRGIVVSFSSEDGNPKIRFDNGKTYTLVRECYRIEQGPRVLATRTQFPLCLAWALTIHKAQGATLNQAVVDVSNAFEAGQVYVALSRVRSLEGLSLTDFDPDRITVHPKALEFEQRNNVSQKNETPSLKRKSDSMS